MFLYNPKTLSKEEHAAQKLQRDQDHAALDTVLTHLDNLEESWQKKLQIAIDANKKLMCENDELRGKLEGADLKVADSLRAVEFWEKSCEDLQQKLMVAMQRETRNENFHRKFIHLSTIQVPDDAPIPEHGLIIQDADHCVGVLGLDETSMIHARGPGALENVVAQLAELNRIQREGNLNFAPGTES